MQDNYGIDIRPNADGTYSLRNGTYYYTADRLYSYKGKYTEYEPEKGSFEVDGDMTLTINIPETEKETNNQSEDVPPSVENTTLYEVTPYNKMGRLVIYHDLGSEATDATLYLIDENDQKIKLQNDIDYNIVTGYYKDEIMLEYDYETDTTINYLLSDEEFLFEHQGQTLEFEIEYNDTNKTTDRFYVKVNEVDILFVLNDYLLEDNWNGLPDTTKKESIQEYMTSILGVESITFSDDFVITPTKLDGTITIVYAGETYTQNYDDYTRYLSTIEFVKKAKNGAIYTISYLPSSYWTTTPFLAVFDSNGTFSDYHEMFGEAFIEVPYGSTIKMLTWESVWLGNIEPLLDEVIEAKVMEQ